MGRTLASAHMWLRLATGFAVAGMPLEPASAQAFPNDADLKLFAVHINRTPQQPWPGYGVYLGSGLILHGVARPREICADKPSCPFCWTGPSSRVGEGRRHQRRGPNLAVCRLDEASGSLANASDAALRSGAVCRRDGCRRHSRRNCTIAHFAAVHGPAGFTQSLRNCNWRRRHNWKLWLGRVRRPKTVPARNRKPENFCSTTRKPIGRSATNRGHRKILRSRPRHQSFHSGRSLILVWLATGRARPTPPRMKMADSSDPSTQANPNFSLVENRQCDDHAKPPVYSGAADVAFEALLLAQIRR